MGNFKLIAGNYSKIYTRDAYRNAMTSSRSVTYSCPIFTETVMHQQNVVKYKMLTYREKRAYFCN